TAGSPPSRLGQARKLSCCTWSQSAQRSSSGRPARPYRGRRSWFPDPFARILCRLSSGFYPLSPFLLLFWLLFPVREPQWQFPTPLKAGVCTVSCVPPLLERFASTGIACTTATTIARQFG